MEVKIPESLYAVMLIQKTIKVNGVVQDLPEGYFFLPVFSDRKAAEKFAGKFGEILELEKPKSKIVEMDF